jgi:hypothetical protein
LRTISGIEDAPVASTIPVDGGRARPLAEAAPVS